MIYTSTLTQKGQATIPVSIRNRLAINPGEKVVFEEKGEEIVIKNPTQLVEELAGSLKTNIKWDKKKAFEAVGKMLAENYLKTLPK